MKTLPTCQLEAEVYHNTEHPLPLPKIDFADTFSTTNHKDDLAQIVRKILTINNRWIRFLFQLRNTLVGFLGLKTTLPADYNEEFTVGGYIGFFKIYAIRPNEVVLGANDAHLNFRLVLTDTQELRYNIKATTLVQFNNRFGSIYMGLIAPFHRLVVRRMVAQAYAPQQP